MNAIKNFMRGEEGAVAIEYALLAALIAIAIVVGATLLGQNICGILNGVGTFLGAVTPNGTATYAFTAC